MFTQQQDVSLVASIILKPCVGQYVVQLHFLDVKHFSAVRTNATILLIQLVFIIMFVVKTSVVKVRLALLDTAVGNREKQAKQLPSLLESLFPVNILIGAGGGSFAYIF